MSATTNIKFKPGELTSHPWGSPLNKFETERIAANISVIMKIGGGDWISFTWGQYKDLCTHNVSWKEKAELERLTKLGYLKKEGELYSVTEKFPEIWGK